MPIIFNTIIYHKVISFSISFVTNFASELLSLFKRFSRMLDDVMLFEVPLLSEELAS